MKPTTLFATVLVVVGVVAAWRPQAASPDQVPPPPDDATRAIVGPVSAKLAGHKEEAGELAAFYRAAADTVRRDADGDNVLKTTANLRTFGERAVTLRFQGVFEKVPGLADTIHGSEGALAKMLGLEVTELDHARAAAAFDAVAWACQEAAR